MKNKNERRQLWADYVREKRLEKGIRKNALGKASGINASYFTLIEGDGYVPSRKFVVRIAEALEVDVKEALLYAGYSPLEDHQIPVILNFLTGGCFPDVPSESEAEAKID